MTGTGNPPTRPAMIGKSMENRAVQEAAWKIITSITLAGVLAVAGMLWKMNGDLAVIKATMVTHAELRQTLNQEVPAPWFRAQVQRIENQLEEHVRQTATAGHRGG